MLDRLLPANPRVRMAIAVIAVVGVSLLLTEFALPSPKGAGGRGTPFAILFEFLVQGALLGLVACGIVLIYRVQVFLNFAASSLGAAGGTFGVLLIRLTPCPFYVAVPAALVVGAGFGALFELVFIRRFFNAPRLTLTVMTVLATALITTVVLGYIQGLPIFPRRATINPAALLIPLRPRLPFPGFHFQVGGLGLPFCFGEIFALWTIVICLAGLAYFFRYTPSGTAVRGLADNPDRAELLGISTRKLSTIIWIIAGALSAAAFLGSAFLTIGAVGTTATSANQNAAINLLLIPLVAAVVARMRSFGVAMLAAILLSIMEGAVGYSYATSGSLITALFFLLLCAGLLLQRKSLLRSEAQTAGGWESTDEIRPIPAELRSVPTVRNTRRALIAFAILAAVLFPFLFPVRLSDLAATSFILGITALSLIVLTGWAGQISLGQLGFTAVGALVGGSLITKVGVPFWFAVPMAVVITSAVALVVGLPALRVKGLFLAAVTFAFGIAADTFLFDKGYVNWLQPGTIPRPRLLVLDFADERSMYYLSLGALLLAAVIVVNLRRSRFGRVLIAMRDNEPALQAAGVPLVRTKLAAFTVSGAIAGFGGALFAVQQRGVDAGNFTAAQSLNLFAFTLIGGITSVAGAILGQVAQFTLTRAGNTNIVFAVIVGFLPLAVLYAFPGGLVGVLELVRDSFLRIVAQRRQIVVPSLFADYDPDALERRLIPLQPIVEGGPQQVAPGVTYRRRSVLYAKPPATVPPIHNGKSNGTTAPGTFAGAAAAAAPRGDE